MEFTYINKSNFIKFRGFNFRTGAINIQVSAASGNVEGGTIEVKTRSSTGTLIGSVSVAKTGGWGVTSRLSLRAS